jgi:muramoyltetrapeptide carboxypeptidase
MITPQYLKKGDEIGIVSTARKITKKELLPAIKIFEEWGLKVRTGKNLFKEYHQFAGTDEERLEDFQEMINDNEIKAIVCARGGYGTVRIVDDIDFTNLIKYPKWIAGFSDVTVLHSHIHSKLGIETLHSAMPLTLTGLPADAPALTSMRKALLGEDLSYQINSHHFNRKGIAEAEVVGGNLSILFSLNNTPSDIITKGKILFIEDLDEYLYHIDRMMMNLKRSGKLEKLAGLVVGGMSDMNDNAVPYGMTACEIIKETAKDYDYPVCYNFPSGHKEDNRALILGRKCRLVVEESVTLSF